ncbi:hypothetical protein PYK22_01883 [Pyrinomonas methylaliphatogenes]|uniref:Uncharacterized protein n=1 Tax=Pyrinomonas methylaliphatogenes TaxID=454194 RepID=A0A0B6X0E5_9BACT|nr:hypothetical protein PYK22_01883 [Pyrinomonas methylaliphatogenes]
MGVNRNEGGLGVLWFPCAMHKTVGNEQRYAPPLIVSVRLLHYG